MAAAEGPSKCQQKREEFLVAISRDIIDLTELRRLAFRGVPDAYRRDYWYVLLGYLPPERADWEPTLERQRALYATYRTEFIVDPQGQEAEEDHPLSLESNSRWGAYLKHQKLLEAIDLDIPRTLPSFNFFHNCCSVENIGEKVEAPQRSRLPVPVVDMGHGVVQFSAQATAMRTVLYIYGVLNAGVGYVQGMNEILAPLYYVVYKSAKDPQAEADNIEADTFFLFSIVMGFLRDNFVRSLDTGGGIQSCIQNMVQLLQVCDPQLHRAMTQKVPHHLYAFRWITLLFSQEYFLPDVLVIWDCLFADHRKFTFLFYLSVAALVVNRDLLISSRATEMLECLQDIRNTVPVLDLINTGRALYKRHGHTLVHNLNGDS